MILRQAVMLNNNKSSDGRGIITGVFLVRGHEYGNAVMHYKVEYDDGYTTRYIPFSDIENHKYSII